MPFKIASLYPFIPCFIFIFGTFGIVMWQKSKRDVKPPIGFDLPRLPGESLRIREQTLLEKFIFWAMGGGVGASAVVIIPYFILQWFPQSNSILLLGSTLVLFIAASILVFKITIATMNELIRVRLGCAGERHVADKLQSLRSYGYAVFHDLPFSVEGQKQNLDHVAIGRHGLLVIETKTRSVSKKDKRGSNEVTFDGERLIWPTYANDRATLNQLERGANWLARWIREECNLDVPVQKMVAIPGWHVIAGKSYNPRVVSGDAVTNAFISITENKPDVLSPAQIKKITVQIEKISRISDW